MAGERTLPGLGLFGFWDYESDGWNEGTDENWRKLSALVHLAAGSRTAALPGSPSNGQIRIVPEGASSNANAIAVRDNDAWVYLPPKTGMRAYIVDDDNFVYFNGTAWTTDAVTGLTDAPQDGGLYARRNGTWTVVEVEGGSDFPEAPLDGKLYGRQDAEWAEIEGGGGDFPEAPQDGRLYARKDAEWAEIVIEDSGGGDDGRLPRRARTWRVNFPNTFPVNNALRVAQLIFRDASGAPISVVGAAITSSQTAVAGSPVDVVFDGRNDTFWRAHLAANNFIQVIFPSAVEVQTVEYVPSPDNYAGSPTSISVLADDRQAGQIVIETAPTSQNPFRIDVKTGGFVRDAPQDDKAYVRRNAAWMEAAGGTVRTFLGAMLRLAANKAWPYPSLPIPWDEPEYDTSGFWSAANPGRLTIPAGVSVVRLHATVRAQQGQTSGNRTGWLEFAKNGSTAFRGSAALALNMGSYSNPPISITSPPIRVEAGDYFEVRQNGTETASVTHAADTSLFALEVLA